MSNKVIKFINSYIIENDLDFVDCRSLFLFYEYLKCKYNLAPKIRSRESLMNLFTCVEKHKQVFYDIFDIISPDDDDMYPKFKYIQFVRDIQSLRGTYKESGRQFEISRNKLEMSIKNKENVIFLFGEPASGKSTFLKSLSDYDFSVFSNDNNRELYYKEETGEEDFTYNKAFQYTQMNKKKFSEYNDRKLKRIFLKGHKNIIIDNTNCFFHPRMKVINYMKEYLKNYERYSVICVYFNRNIDIIKQNRDKRYKEEKKFISDEVIEKFRLGKTPVFEDYFDYFVRIKYDS